MLSKIFEHLQYEAGCIIYIVYEHISLYHRRYVIHIAKICERNYMKMILLAAITVSAHVRVNAAWAPGADFGTDS